MKKIFLVRHAESFGNAGNKWQGADEGLTERGVEQAHAVGARLAGISFDALISSPMRRASQTSAIVAEHCAWDKDIEFSDLFVERKKPSELIGVERVSEKSHEIDRELTAHFGEPGWHHSDEENFEDMTSRARKALQLLVDHPADDIVVLTHGYFMRVLAATAIVGDSLTPGVIHHFLTSFRTANTGITLLVFL